jgi:protein-tyrosine phosphatase
MIDLHCHILPGIDDGAKSETMSIEMAKKAVAEGITHIVATPHHNNGRYVNEKTSIMLAVDELNSILVREQLPLTILPGQEPRIYGDILQDYQADNILTINNLGKYMLIEFPSNHVPKYAKQLLFDIQLQDIIPIIVHPERNQELIEKPNLLYQFVQDGALTQVTASSISGNFGKKIKKFSLELLDFNLTHVIASDAHNTSGRSFHLREAYEVVEKELGRDYRYILEDNAEIIITGGHVYKEQPQRIQKKKFLGIF